VTYNSLDHSHLLDVWFHLASRLNASEESLTTFKRRSSEGLNFLTRTLPELGKCIDNGLSHGFNRDSHQFRTQKDSELPAFLSEFTSAIFNDDGSVKTVVDCGALKTVRQLCYIFYKLLVKPTPMEEALAEQKFIDVDSSVKTCDYPESLPDVKAHFLSIVKDCDPYDIRPHHASGATAEKLTNYQKRYNVRYIPDLHKVYNITDHFLNEDCARMHFSIHSSEPCSPSARFTTVPKDSRGPRGICIEPSEIMYFQKGQQEALYRHIESTTPAKGFINFTDQSINRRLALQGSIDGSLATIDLKDASDLVPYNLIMELVNDDWKVALSATRSKTVEVGQNTINLNKFSAMGSANCFAIEACLFWSIARTVTDFAYVYGDDIICKNSDAELVMCALESYGLKVNKDKSLHIGSFRESCGGEYFAGHDISYVKYKSSSFKHMYPFINLIGEHFSHEISDELFELCQKKHNQHLYAEPLEHASEPRELVYYTNNLDIISGVMSSFKFRIPKKDAENDYNRVQVRRLVAVKGEVDTLRIIRESDAKAYLTRENRCVPAHYGYHDWITRHDSVMPWSSYYERFVNGSKPPRNLDYLPAGVTNSYADRKLRNEFRWEETNLLNIPYNSMN